eukprot:726408-Pyramimonas_sp.AAC.1
MRQRDTIWSMHDAPATKLPSDAADWCELPTLEIADLKTAVLQFPWATGIGQFSFAPRSLIFLSDVGLEVLAQLFMRCEKLLFWPSSRTLTQLVRLPKPSGVCRLIALLNTLLRVWGRARRPIASAWELSHDLECYWGAGAGRSSSDSAFSLNLDAEISREVGEGSLTVFIDMLKCYETVVLQSLLDEARE